MNATGREYRIFVRSHRLIVPGLLDTWRDQGPAVQAAMSKIADELNAELGSLDGGGWTVVSHSAVLHSGLIIASFLLSRDAPPAPPA